MTPIIDNGKDSVLNMIFSHLDDAVSIHNTIHALVLEAHFDDKNLTPDKRNLALAVREIYVKKLSARTIEILESAIHQYKTYKENFDKIQEIQKRCYSLRAIWYQ